MGTSRSFLVVRHTKKWLGLVLGFNEGDMALVNFMHFWHIMHYSLTCTIALPKAIFPRCRVTSIQEVKSSRVARPDKTLDLALCKFLSFAGEKEFCRPVR